MARAPRTRRPPVDDDELATFDPLDAATFADAVETAGDLGDAFGALRAYDSNTIKGVLFRKPPNGLGKFQWIEDLGWPFDMSAIMGSLKAAWGGGDYRLQILAGTPQKTRKVLEFSIADDGKSRMAPAGGGGSADMMALMMQMQMEQSRQAQASADRQMQLMVTMMTNSTQQSVAMMTAMMGQPREGAKDFIPLIAAMRDNTPPTTMKDTVETLVALKGLLPNGEGGGGSFDPDDLVGSVAKFAGPVLGAVGKAMDERSRRLSGGQQLVDEAPGGQLLAPAPEPLSLAAPVRQVVEPAGAADAKGLVALMRPHVLYFFNAHLDAELAAEAIASILDATPGAEGMVNDLVAEFALSPDWKSDLAAQGIDLRSNPEWADTFLGALVREWTETEPADSDDDRPGGGNEDVAVDEAAGALRLGNVNGAEPGGGPDH